MKKMIAMLCMAALCAGAAEVEKFSLKYLKSSRASKLQAKGMTSVKGVIPFEKQLVFSLTGFFLGSESFRNLSSS